MEDNRIHGDQGPCDPLPARTYTGMEALAHNLPYILMIAFGAAAIFTSFGVSAWGRAAGAGYIAYGLLGALWIMVFVCPFCRFWGTDACPCGYGNIAARIRSRQAQDRFSEKFKRHIPVIVPLWFLPLAAAAPVLARGFRWDLVILVILFALDAFVILPRFSTQHGCRDCPQRQECPWMKGASPA